MGAAVAFKPQLRDVVRELKRRQTPDDLHPKQRVAFETDANEVLYGGAAGGGKSHLMRRAAITWCKWVPGLQVYLFRREFSDLFKNHMEGPAGFPVLLAEDVASGAVRIVWSKNQIRFTNGSVIHLCHCQHEKDVFGYQGAEIHVLMIDELTQWTAKMYRYLRSRMRLGGLKVPAWLAGRFPRAICGANPGGIGHNWVKADFVDVAPPLAVTQMASDEGGMRRQFIPALLEDNPTQDPEYAAKLEGLGDPTLVKAMLGGIWDIVAGGMFDDVWDRGKHVLPPFTPPTAWRIDRSFDWGSSAPFSVGWWAEANGEAATINMPDGSVRIFCPPKGSLIRIAEWYGWDGKNPNVGIKMTDTLIGKGIVQREAQMGLRGRVHPGPADSSIWSDKPGQPTTAAELAKEGAVFTPADKSPGTIKRGCEAIRRMLTESAKDKPEKPGMWIVDTCLQFIRTIPTLPRSETKPDEPNTAAEDHIADETRYRVLAVRNTMTVSTLRV